jgi:hypothetical protein
MNNVVICSYLTAAPDTQRKKILWPADYSAIQPLIDSLERFGAKMILLHDCFDGTKDTDTVTHIRVPKGGNPYWYRWQIVDDYLQANGHQHDWVWCVDSTDVEMLHDPFIKMEDRLYIGDEPEKTGIPFLRKDARDCPWLAQFVEDFAEEQLLNCGLVGGTGQRVTEFIHTLMTHQKQDPSVGRYEMGLFNYVARKMYSHVLVHGEPVNTRFRGMDRNNAVCWWRHK